jgi:hypothetical protein
MSPFFWLKPKQDYNYPRTEGRGNKGIALLSKTVPGFGMSPLIHLNH